MVSATKFQDGFKLGVTPRQLEEAQQAAQTALDAFAQPEEVRPGQWLCCRGRVIRAVHIAGTRPQEEWPKLQIEVSRLAAIADQRYQQWIEAERRYRELCKQASVEPALSQGETCTCEGCQIEEANIRHVQEAKDRRPPLPKHLWQRFKDFAEARTVQASYRNEFKTAMGFDRETGEYVLAAPGQANV
jgi:hypothetical protein